MFTNLKYGLLTAPENLFLEFSDANHVSLKTSNTVEFNSGHDTPERGGVRTPFHNWSTFPNSDITKATTIINNYSSHLNSIYETKEMLPQRMVEYKTLRSSSLYKTALYYGQLKHFPCSAHYALGTDPKYLSSISNLKFKAGWNDGVDITTGLKSTNAPAVHDLVYGSKRTTSYIRDSLDAKAGGIFGNSNISPIEIVSSNTPIFVPGIWNLNYSFKDQPLLNRTVNALLTGNPGNFLSSDPRYGSLHRDTNIPPPGWQTITISDIPPDAKYVRIFQDRYTGGGGTNTPHDNYCIASVSGTFTGTYQ
jgi:hypothetical protein